MFISILIFSTCDRLNLMLFLIPLLKPKYTNWPFVIHWISAVSVLRIVLGSKGNSGWDGWRIFRIPRNASNETLYSLYQSFNSSIKETDSIWLSLLSFEDAEELSRCSTMLFTSKSFRFSQWFSSLEFSGLLLESLTWLLSKSFLSASNTKHSLQLALHSVSLATSVPSS